MCGRSRSSNSVGAFSTSIKVESHQRNHSAWRWFHFLLTQLLLLSPVFRRPVRRQCLLPAADHSSAHNHPPGPPGPFLTPPLCRRLALETAATLPFNPSPLLNSAGASQVPPRHSPGAFLHPRQTQRQYRKQYGGGAPGATPVGSRSENLQLRLLTLQRQ